MSNPQTSCVPQERLRLRHTGGRRSRKVMGKAPVAFLGCRRAEGCAGFHHPAEDSALAAVLHGGFRRFEQGQGVMEMCDLFLQLQEEVSRLQELCTEQGKLLQELAARRGSVPVIPTLLPMQCPEDAVMKEGERPAHSPQREDAPRESARPAEAKAPVGIRGPEKPSWAPGWVLEEASLGPGAILTSAGAQARDIGQEVSPRTQEAKRTP
ncbi:uncharacterized protein LOC136003730 [Lathamus discolor]|uniref:uncharacterized protein LOC136003730 n=1 Tax=Lathamus discolor TaxID=678569 RepID=UPI0032B85F76